MISIRLILILSNLLFILSKVVHPFNCSDVEVCYCTQSPDRGYEISCPHYSDYVVKISFDFDEEEALEIDCTNSRNYFNSIPDNYLPPNTSDLELKSLRFMRCSLPENVTVKEVMRVLKIVNTTSFRISYSDIRNVTRADLAGLETIKSLEVLGNTIGIVKEDLLYDLKNLETIDIKTNNIVIPQKFFWGNPNLKSIEIAENFLPENTTGLFKNQRGVKHINMWAMGIKNLDGKIFEGLTNLSKLDLSVNQISTLPADFFKNLSSLQILSLRRNKFKTLPHGFFQHNSNLEIIYLNENIHLSEVPENLLADKVFLKNVSLNDCNLTTLSSSFFQNSDNLEMLDLRNNNLQTLPNDLLRSKTKLRSLSLENNYLEHLPYDFFKDLTDLQYLNLNDNYLQLTSNNFDKQFNMKSLHLSNNNLHSVDSSTFKNLRRLVELDLSFNKLTLLSNVGFWSPLSNLATLEKLILSNNNVSIIFNDWKISLLKLRKLDLSNNTFTNLAYTDMSFTQKKISINLEYNLISDINMSLAEALRKIQLLDEPEKNPIPSYRQNQKEIIFKLNHNPLRCGCNLYDLYRYFDLSLDPEVRFGLTLEANQLFCKSPENMANKKVSEIDSKSFVCEFQNKYCLELATCYYKPNGKIFIIDLSAKGLLEAPELTALKENKSTIFQKNVVWLQENNIAQMPKPGMGYEHVQVLNLSKNKIEYIDWIPENLEILQLNDNKLTFLNDKTLSQLNSSRLMNMSLYNNPWTCNCSTISFLKFIQDKWEKLEQMQDITCKNTNQQISDLTTDELCPLPTYLIIFLCVFVAFLGIFIAILTFLYNRYNMEIKVWLFAHQQCLWLVTEDEIDKDKIYDAFISYSHHDEDFIIPELIEKLENGPNGYKLCLHFRNWQPGEFISKNIANSIADSRRTIVILSKNFLESEWGKMEFRVAHKQALEENRARVIIILLGEIPFDYLDDEIKAYLNTNTYLKWGEPWFWDKLRYALPHSHVKNYQVLDKVISSDDKVDLSEPITPIGTTPPIDKILTDPLKNNNALNVALVNGSLLNGYVIENNKLFGANAELYDCNKINIVNNTVISNTNFISR